MALPTPTGQLNQTDNTVYPVDSSTWATVPSTWADWDLWAYAPADPLVWVTDLLDVGQICDFNLRIITDAQGLVEYTVYTSNTGAFAGEENSTDIAQDQAGIEAFSGRYAIVAVKVYKTSGINILRSVEVTASTTTVNIQYNSLDTSTLSGTTSGRTLVLPRTVSKIYAMEVTAHETASAFNLDLYVSSTQTSRQLMPRIVSKATTGPVIALYGLDNQPRDGVVDIKISAFGEQYMTGNNLLNR